MAIVPMKKVEVIALKKERKALMEYLQRLEVMELATVPTGEGIFRKNDVYASKNLLQKSIAQAEEAITILQEQAASVGRLPSPIAGRAVRTVDEYEALSKEHARIQRLAGEIIDAKKEINEANRELARRAEQLEQLKPWEKLDMPMQWQGSKRTAFLIGTLPGEQTKEELEKRLLTEDGRGCAEVTVHYADASLTYLSVLCMREDKPRIQELLRKEGFLPPAYSTKRVPAGQKSRIEDIRASLVRLKQEKADWIDSQAGKLEQLLLLGDYERIRLAKYEALEALAQGPRSLVLVGYVPAARAEELQHSLEERFTAVVGISEPEVDDEVPVLLKNNALAAPLESTVAAYALPTKGELDPTFAVSLFYYILFGLMLSDAGYGALMVLGCGGLLWKYRATIETGMKRTLQMYLYCGLSTVFWGVMFGSYFGDIVDVTAKTFFNKTVSITKMLYFTVKDPMKMLVFSLIFGIVHLYFGLIMKTIQCAKNRQWKDILYDVVFWIGLLSSCIVILVSTSMLRDMFGYSFLVPDTAVTIAGWIAIICAIGIIATNGRESKHPFKRFLKGAYALYGISSYLSDVLSYSRLLALGLATGVIATVINTMAAMAGGIGGIIGFIIFAVICVFGHLLNLGINALGAYVHTNRLQYVEFFGKFYEGGGRAFAPFSQHSKYFKFKESK
ncbi:MAG: V-type ATP synthase subunit I [Lachnospiraceae bacterium]|nr:V-type ATP synthase subunit I [Lachnospiraceae bacterium]